MSKKSKVFLTVLSFVLFLPALSFSLVPYDDFSGASIDKTKWVQREGIREIREGKLLLKQASSGPIGVSSFPSVSNDNMSFIDPNSINSIQADVTVLEITCANPSRTGPQTGLRLGGTWYRVAAGSTGDWTGNILAEIALKQGPSGLIANYSVARFTNEEGSSWVLVKSGDFTTAISTGATYTLSIAYDSVSNQFVFRVGSEQVTCGEADGLPVRYDSPSVPFKAIGSRVCMDDGTQSESISGTFDNVNTNSALYDDFSSLVIDQAKWDTYEMVREISEGKLRSKVRSSTASAYSIFVPSEFPNPCTIDHAECWVVNAIPFNVIQTKVTPTVYQNEQGANAGARVGGFFYNDGTPGGNMLGLVGAEVYIGGTGVIPIGGWTVWTYSDYGGNNAVIIASGTFATPITVGNTYTLLLGWDGSQFTFKIDNEVTTYTPVTSILPPYYFWKEIGAWIYTPAGKEATIGALFDDVMVDPGPGIVDFDGDQKSDISIWRPGDGYWHSISSKDGSTLSQQWGSGAWNDVPVAGDYDGDRKTDIAVWRPSDGYWYILHSASAGVTTVQWGSSALNDVPVPGDYDGDRKTDVAVWRPGDGFWYVVSSKDGSILSQQWGSGALNDKTIPGDYDGDGVTDYAVWRPGDGFWYILKSSDGGVLSQQWGSSALNDVPVPGDYDGDGKTDIAVWRPDEGFWYIIHSKDGSIVAQQWGAGYAPYNDLPVPGDYDGDGKTDIAVWRPGDGFWYILKSSDGGVIQTQWGSGSLSDEPISQ